MFILTLSLLSLFLLFAPLQVLVWAVNHRLSSFSIGVAENEVMASKFQILLDLSLCILFLPRLKSF